MLKSIGMKTQINKSNRGSGFVQIIILIIIALFLMKYYGVTISGVINWFTTTFKDVLK